ncbi:hypothetical protein HMPREF1109_0654 [Streptococcus intermedius SK54 = ATCC 27335]|nr:hypothetical protein HMPREF1109_0654 [Streptococcus intermedius SK54 = ATCC 27335]EKU16438.1 hypothetical protein D593_1621 [Streptococcus intermedius BA1]
MSIEVTNSFQSLKISLIPQFIRKKIRSILRLLWFKNGPVSFQKAVIWQA